MAIVHNMPSVPSARPSVLSGPSAPLRPPQLPDPEGSFDKPRCSKCGLVLDVVMGYVCGDLYCPTFMKAVW